MRCMDTGITSRGSLFAAVACTSPCGAGTCALAAALHAALKSSPAVMRERENVSTRGRDIPVRAGRDLPGSSARRAVSQPARSPAGCRWRAPASARTAWCWRPATSAPGTAPRRRCRAGGHRQRRKRTPAAGWCPPARSAAKGKGRVRQEPAAQSGEHRERKSANCAAPGTKQPARAGASCGQDRAEGEEGVQEVAPAA